MEEIRSAMGIVMGKIPDGKKEESSVATTTVNTLGQTAPVLVNPRDEMMKYLLKNEEAVKSLIERENEKLKKKAAESEKTKKGEGRYVTSITDAEVELCEFYKRYNLRQHCTVYMKLRSYNPDEPNLYVVGDTVELTRLQAYMSAINHFINRDYISLDHAPEHEVKKIHVRIDDLYRIRHIIPKNVTVWGALDKEKPSSILNDESKKYMVYTTISAVVHDLIESAIEHHYVGRMDSITDDVERFGATVMNYMEYVAIIKVMVEGLRDLIDTLTFWEKLAYHGSYKMAKRIIHTAEECFDDDFKWLVRLSKSENTET